LFGWRRSNPWALVAASAVITCSRSPDRVYVPGDSFRYVVRISTAQGEHATVAVGEPLRLHASRRSGPWIEKAAKDVPDTACRTSALMEEEPEVAAELAWNVEPEGVATFNVPTVLTAGDRTREVRFSQPGEYRLKGVSFAPCTRETSNVITVSVAPK
jgi:hypothetical protein